jgi:hypothetical protein
MLSLALEKKCFVFTKDDVAKVGGMFSTSEKMYLCQVPNFGFEMIKVRPDG